MDTQGANYLAITATAALREIGFTPGNIMTLEASNVAARMLRERGFSDVDIAAAIAAANDKPQSELTDLKVKI